MRTDKANTTKGKVKLVKTGDFEVTLVFPKGTGARLRSYAPVEDVLAVLRCPAADVDGQMLRNIKEVVVGCSEASGGC